MAQLNWPDINPHNSQNALHHLATLDAYFETLDACVELSSSKHHRLPSSLQQDIIRAILKAFSDNDFPFEMSEADSNLIGGLLLKHMALEAAARARDRIPLKQYHNLRQSYKQLVAKLHELLDTARVEERGGSSVHEPSPELESMHEIRDSVSRQSEAVRSAGLRSGDDTIEGAGQADLPHGQGRDATKAVISIDRPKKKGRKRKDRDEVSRAAEGDDLSATTDGGGTLEIMGNQPGAEEVDVHIDRPKKKGRKRKDRDGVRQATGGDNPSATGVGGGTLEIMGNQPGVEEVDVHKDNTDSGVETDDHEDLMRMLMNTEAQCERIRLQLQEYESWRLEESAAWHVTNELMEDQDMVGKHVVEEDDSGIELVEGDSLGVDPGDLVQRPNGQEDNQTRFERAEQLQQGQEMKQDIAGPDTSSLITFNIKTQAAVNHLNEIGSDGILQRLSDSLEAMRSLGYDPPDSIHLIDVMLLDNGDVEVHAHARSEEDMERLRRIRGWDLEFEKSISPPAKSYAVEIPRMNRDNLTMQNRKYKATVINELLEENSRFVVSLRGVGDIRNIRWSKCYGKESSLVIDFRTAQQADEVLNSGIFIRGKNYKCQSVDQIILRCGRCQAFGHHEMRCSSAHRCGRCSSEHRTSACTSNFSLCANCDGPHEAKDATCPAREAFKQRLRYNNSSSSVEGTEHVETVPGPQRRTVTFRLPSPNSISTTSQNEREVKIEEDESLQDVRHIGEYRGRAAALERTLMPADPQHEPYVKAEGGDHVQEMDLTQRQPTQKQHPDLTSIQRQLEDIQKKVEQLSRPQHPHPKRRKREGDEMLTGGPSSYARRQPRPERQSRDDRPMRTQSHLPADWNLSPYAAGALPGQRTPRQFFIRSL